MRSIAAPASSTLAVGCRGAMMLGIGVAFRLGMTVVAVPVVWRIRRTRNQECRGNRQAHGQDNGDGNELLSAEAGRFFVQIEVHVGLLQLAIGDWCGHSAQHAIEARWASAKARRYWDFAWKKVR